MITVIIVEWEDELILKRDVENKLGYIIFNIF